MFERLKNNIRPIIFYIIFFLFILAASLSSNGYDYDLWARLSVGKYFIQTGHVLKHDIFSYTPTHLWFDHEWGSGVIFYLVQHYFSYLGILFTHVILMFLIFFVLTKIIKLRGVTTTHPYNFLFYYLAFMSISYLTNEILRCQMFSFLFFTIFLYILELARKDNNKWLWTMPFIMIIWNNLHGGCTAGIGLLVIYIVGELLNGKSIRKYVLTFLVTILTLPITPWGLSYLVFLLKATTMSRSEIVEWWSLFYPYHKYNYIEFKMLAPILLLFESIFITRSIKAKTFNFDKTKYLAIIVTLFFAYIHVKLIPLCVITMSAFLYDDFYTVFNSITMNAINKIATIKDILVYIAVIIFIFMNLNRKNFEPFVNWDKYPITIIEFIKINNLKGKLFINYGLGSYAGYKLYPNNKTFIDGRYEEVYYDYIMPILHNFISGEDRWYRLLEEYPPDLVIVEKFYPIYSLMLSRPDWVQIFQDTHYGLFIKSDKAKKTYKLPPMDIQYYKQTVFDTDLDFSKEKGK